MWRHSNTSFTQHTYKLSHTSYPPFSKIYLLLLSVKHTIWQNISLCIHTRHISHKYQIQNYSVISNEKTLTITHLYKEGDMKNHPTYSCVGNNCVGMFGNISYIPYHNIISTVSYISYIEFLEASNIIYRPNATGLIIQTK